MASNHPREAGRLQPILLLTVLAASLEVGLRVPAALKQSLPEDLLARGVVLPLGFLRAIPVFVGVALLAFVASLPLGVVRYSPSFDSPRSAERAVWLGAAVLLRLVSLVLPEAGLALLLIGVSWVLLAAAAVGSASLRRLTQLTRVEALAASGGTALLIAGLTLRHPIRIVAMVATGHAVDWLLRLLPGKHTFGWEGIYPSITFNSFDASIGAGCAGLHSATAFTALISLIWLVEGSRWRAGRLPWLYLGGLLLFFTENVFRITALFLIGAWYSADIALGIFHSTAGWMLFVMTFALFMWVVLRTDAVQSPRTSA